MEGERSGGQDKTKQRMWHVAWLQSKTGLNLRRELHSLVLCELGLHDILHVIVMCISSVKTVLRLVINLHQLEYENNFL